MFSVLTSKIFGGAALALAAYHIVDEIGDNRRAAAQAKTIATQATEITTLRGNVDKYQLALAQCNQGVKNTATVAQQVAASGQAAVRAVQEAGGRNEVIVRNINAAPAQTCTDAEAILRGDAG